MRRGREKAPGEANQRGVIRTLILNLRERKPPIRAKATCGQPSITTITVQIIKSESKTNIRLPQDCLYRIEKRRDVGTYRSARNCSNKSAKAM